MKKITMEKLPKEFIKPGVNDFKFINLKPGGNDTSLVVGIIRNPRQRRDVNDEIMGLYPNIEQVGFVDLNPKDPELVMAGGEFCGNATRSTAYLALDGKPGEVSIKVSGVSRKLKAGVTEKGEAFAEMPIYKYPGMIATNISQDRYLVPLEGITQYVDFNTEEIKGLSGEQIKAKAKDTIDKLGLSNLPAAGVIYTEKIGDNWSITPVVWVKSIDTLFLETACGSGTVALGQVLAMRQGRSIKDVPVYQPSGMPINVSVDFVNDEFRYAEISGPIQKLSEGLRKIDINGDPLVLEQVNQNNFEQVIGQTSLIELYKDVFSKWPYFERFEDQEVANFFKEYVATGKVLLARNRKKVIGFSASMPLEDDRAVSEFASEFGIDVKNCSYIAELGVDENYRRKKIGQNLISSLLSIDAKSYSLLRTNRDNLPAINLYKNLGFEVIPGMTQTIERPRQAGRDFSDERIFLIKRLT